MTLKILVRHLQKSQFLSVLNTHSSQDKFDITQSIHWLRDIKTETTEKSCYLETLIVAQRHGLSDQSNLKIK